MRTRIILVLTTLALVAAGAVGVLKLRQFLDDDSRRDYLGAGNWPTHGQAAFTLADGPVRASSGQRPAPIASLAKVMTAFVVLQRHPDAAGITVRVTADDVADTAERKDQDQSVVEVAAGEQLSGRQALAALLLPSANNVAVMLARAEAGSVHEFVGQMNRTAGSLGMAHTTYTDPSGFDPRTVSTARDQLALARAAMRLPLFRSLVGRSSYQLPVAGTVHNTDTLLGTDGFAGIKTGSMDASGGCFMFLTRRDAGDLYGVVLGQQGHNLISAGLYAGKQLADRVSS